MPRINSLFVILLTATALAIAFLAHNRWSAENELNDLANVASQNTPRMIADNLQLDSVKADFPSLVFYYTYFVGSDEVDGESIRMQEMQWLRDNSCGHTNGYQSVLAKGFNIKRHYQDLNGQHIALVQFSASDCTSGK